MMMMAHTYKPLSLVKKEAFCRMVTHLDPSTRPITRYKLKNTLIPHKLEKSETDVSSLLGGVRCVVISYELWMSKKTHAFFSIKAHYTRDHVREHAHISMPIKTSTYGESLAATVGNLINQFNLGSKLVGVTSYGRTNLAACKAILESNFDNMGVFDFEKPMFVMECLDHVLDNTCKAGVMDVKSDYGGVDNEVTRRNMQRCITWTKQS